MPAEILYDDKWGEIIDHPDAGFVEIRWFDTTSEMTGDEFNNYLSEFATRIERTGRQAALIDAVQFRMPMDRMSVGWRDETIVPRYNAVDLKKFAFIMPPGMPLVGKDPQTEDSAEYPTSYFDSRSRALFWLST